MARRTDRAVENAWRFTLGLLIFAAALCGVVMLYHAFFAGIDAQWTPMTVQTALALALGWGVLWLCNNHGDLTGEV